MNSKSKLSASIMKVISKFEKLDDEQIKLFNQCNKNIELYKTQTNSKFADIVKVIREIEMNLN